MNESWWEKTLEVAVILPTSANPYWAKGGVDYYAELRRGFLLWDSHPPSSSPQRQLASQCHFLPAQDWEASYLPVQFHIGAASRRVLNFLSPRLMGFRRGLQHFRTSMSGEKIFEGVFRTSLISRKRNHKHGN